MSYVRVAPGIYIDDAGETLYVDTVEGCVAAGWPPTLANQQRFSRFAQEALAEIRGRPPWRGRHAPALEGVRMTAGDRVGYTAAFVRSVGGALYEVGSRRGTIETLEGDDRIAVVRWDDEPDRPQRVLTVNIAAPGSARFSDPSIRPRKEP